MTELTWTFNNFWKTARIGPKFHPYRKSIPVKTPQFPRAPYSHAVWWAISETIKWTPLVLFVRSEMAYENNFSSKLPVADRIREVWGRKLCWWCLSSSFPLCRFLLGFADSFCFVVTSSPSYEASPLCSILCNLLKRLCWYVEFFKGGFEDVLVSLLLTTMGAFSNL